MNSESIFIYDITDVNKTNLRSSRNNNIEKKNSKNNYQRKKNDQPNLKYYALLTLSAEIIDKFSN